MRYTYPISIIKDKDYYVVNIPDFNTGTQGKDLADAMNMARDCIGMMMLSYGDLEKEFPVATDISTLDISDGIVTLVDIDFDSYKAKHDNTPVKKNCSIPRYMYNEVERLHLNCSKILQDALAEKIASYK